MKFEELAKFAKIDTGNCFYILALTDYEMAIKLDPKNTKLQEDAGKLRKIIQGS